VSAFGGSTNLTPRNSKQNIQAQTNRVINNNLAAAAENKKLREGQTDVKQATVRV
jgi:hypothetical protein